MHLTACTAPDVGHVNEAEIVLTCQVLAGDELAKGCAGLLS